MKRLAVIAILMTVGSAAIARGKVPVVIVIRDLAYLKKTLGDGAFVPEKKDCYDARADVPRFVRLKMKQAKSENEAFAWRHILLKEPVYVWHCGGITSDDKRFLTCTFSRYEKNRGLDNERFPEMFDNGTDHCQAKYSLQIRRIVLITCNGVT